MPDCAELAPARRTAALVADQRRVLDRCAAQPDLRHRRHLERAPQRAGVVVLRVEVLVAQVGVRIERQHREPGRALRVRAHRRRRRPCARRPASRRTSRHRSARPPPPRCGRSSPPASRCAAPAPAACGCRGGTAPCPMPTSYSSMSADASMIARGPSRVPARAVTVESYGTGRTTTRDRSKERVLSSIERSEVAAAADRSGSSAHGWASARTGAGRAQRGVRTAPSDRRRTELSFRAARGAAQPRVEDVAQRVAEQVERQHDEADHDAGEDDRPRVLVALRSRRRSSGRSPSSACPGVTPRPEEAQRRLREHGDREEAAQPDEDERHDVRQHVTRRTRNSLAPVARAPTARSPCASR